jgi:acyl-lipid omega-6 desaturase (Delta-12 desaturase)
MRDGTPESPARLDLGPRTVSSIWQLVNSVVPFLALLYLMYLSLAVSVWLTLGLGVLAGGFMVRIFIIQHDCGHGSFFRSRKANNRVGRFCSVLTMVPYYYWRRQHALHHASSGNLDHRGHGDMEIYTVDEYLKLSRRERFYYRAYRNPLVFLLLGPLVLLFIFNRLPLDRRQSTKAQRRNVHMTNLTMAGLFLALGFTIGFGHLLLIALPVLYVAGGAGIWLFYIQHQFEHTYWKRGAEWNAARAAMQGSSFYKLPRVLQWFTGNIGFHHIHHLRETIPNYRLPRLFREDPEFQDVYTVTVGSSLKTMFLSVWDEKQERLISFREMARRYMSMQQPSPLA